LKNKKRNLVIFVVVFMVLCISTIDLFSQGYTTQAYDWGNVEIVGGGFVPGIIYSRGESGLVYARTDIGGAYRMNRSTGRWVPLFDWVGWDNWNLTGILSLAADPVDTNRVYAACGSYTNSWDSRNGAIARSSDYGETWQITDMPFKIGGNMPSRGCGERLAVDPNNNSIIYFGAPGDQSQAHGLWRSTDYGVSWSEVTSFPNPGDYIDDPADELDYLDSYQGIYWVTFDEDTGSPGSTTQTIYVGVADNDGTCVYRTTNGGSSWALVPGQPTSLACPHKGKLDTVNNFLYVAYSNNGGPYDGTMGDVWRLDTTTDTWLCISPVENNGVAGEGDNYFGYSGLSIDRQTPTTLMVTGYSSWWPDTMIWRSTDSGVTWTAIWEWVSYPTRNLNYNMSINDAPWLEWGGNPGDAEVLPKLGWMTESLEINPFNSNEMIYGTGATIFGTTNLTSWDSGGSINISVMCEGLEETSVLALISPPSGPELISGLGDIYGFAHTDIDSVPSAFFTEPQIATTGIDFAELNPSFVYRVGNGGEELNYVVQKNSGSSTNGGASWTMNWNEPEGITEGGIVAVGSTGTNVVWSPIGTAVHYSSTNGSNWTQSNGIPNEAFVASDRVNPTTFYGFSGGTFYVSTDGGANFSSTASGIGSAGKLRGVPGEEGHVWLGAGEDGLWRSTDGGNTVTQVTNVEEADVVGFGATISGSYPAVYTSAQVDGKRGIFRSDDAGASWIRINDDAHQWAWTGKTITGDPRNPGRVYIGTNGRGIIVGEPAGTIVTPTPTPTPVDTPTPEPFTRGDVNTDGNINIVDALLVAQYYVGLEVQNFNPDAADTSCDGNINIVDALLIAQYYVGLIEGFCL